MSDKSKNYVTASHEVKPDDLEFEKNNIVYLTDKKDDYHLTLKHLFFGKFKYDREDIKLVDGKPPYGECFSTAFNEDGSLLACGYSNGHVNIFNLKEPHKDPIEFNAATYPITSLK